jgi:hypothetical protein
MKERDAEINRLLGEQKRYQTQLLGLQVQNYHVSTAVGILCCFNYPSRLIKLQFGYRVDYR